MGTINLEDATVSYEGQNLPAIHLIGKLQAQLEEASRRIAAIASTLGDVQAALLNSNMVEAKLTLSREEYERFKSLGGVDDSERIRKAVMSLIHAEVQPFPPSPGESRPAAIPGVPGPFTLPTESRTDWTQAAEAPLPRDPEPLPEERIFSEQQAGGESPVEPQSTTTRCPRCQSLIVLPEASGDRWSVEAKCENCGVKYLVKSRPDDFA